MLLNRTLKRDKNFQQTVQSKFYNTGSTNFKTKAQSSSRNELTEYQLQLLNYKQSLTKDINHPRIRQLIMNHQKIHHLLNSSSQAKQNLKNNIINMQLLQQRKWLTKKGKKYLIDFDDNQRKQMKDCFNAMDIKKSGSIGIDQLEELLISVGLMQSREEVKQLIDSVDQDKSGKIQFSQFLKMILNDQGQNQEIVQFFKFIINSNRKKNQQQIQWVKKSQSKSRSKSKQFQSTSPQKSKQKLSFLQEKQNIFNPCCLQKSSFHQKRNKFYSSPQNAYSHQNLKKNSALNIFEKHPHPKNLPFGMIVSHIRRKHMMTALKINQNDTPNMKKMNSSGNCQAQNRSNHYISSNILRSSQNMKDSKASSNQTKSIFSQDEVVKGQSVMNALRRMWDRRMLRQLKQRKNKKQINGKSITVPLTQKVKNTKQMNNIFPNVN